MLRNMLNSLMKTASPAPAIKSAFNPARMSSTANAAKVFQKHTLFHRMSDDGYGYSGGTTEIFSSQEMRITEKDYKILDKETQKEQARSKKMIIEKNPGTEADEMTLNFKEDAITAISLHSKGKNQEREYSVKASNAAAQCEEIQNFFGEASQAAVSLFSAAVKKGQSAEDFLKEQGHQVKSMHTPGM